MSIMDLKRALEPNRISQGYVYINEIPEIRSGKKGDFMVGRFRCREQEAEFRIWDEPIFKAVRDGGTGVYEAEVVGSSFNGNDYLTVRSIAASVNPEIKKSDFLAAIPRILLEARFREVQAKLSEIGVTDTCWRLINTIIEDPELNGRFMIEGAAVRYHDNIIGGLANHTIKMLNILAAVLENNRELLPNADLFTLAVTVHDIGKVYEYDFLEVSEFWYASHRVRGIEYLTRFADAIIAAYDEAFYRQVQAVIAGHHGNYGDRPTTVAAAIVHYIDTLESQTTRLVQEVKKSDDGRVRDKEWGFLMGLPLGNG